MISLIVARSKNNVIGRNGRIPWKIKGEQKQFRELTLGNVVVMGRKTFEEIGYPLDGRENIVVSKSKTFSAENLITVSSLDEAIAFSEGKNIYVAGGYELYKEALPLADKLYVTEVDITVPDGDLFFPEFDKEDFETEAGETGGDEIKFFRMVYTRKNK